MNLKKFFKINKASKSILIVILLFSAFTLTPLVNGTTFYKYKNESSTNHIFNYNLSGFQRFVDKLQNEIFNKNYSSKIDLIRNIKYEAKKIHNEVCDILTKKKDINDMSSQIENLLTVFDNNFDIDRLSDEVSASPEKDWANYSDIYNKTVACWQLNASYWEKIGDRWSFLNFLDVFGIFTHPTDNYRSWFLDYTDSYEGYSLVSDIVLFVGVSLLWVASPTTGDGGIFISTLGGIITAFVLWFDLNLLNYFSQTYKLFSYLLTMEINIYLQVIDNSTGNGINGLNLFDEKRGILATNIDARKLCSPGKPGWEDDDFTYYLQPVENISINGNCSGWYCLSSRLHPAQWYERAPCPPGDWDITIKLPTNSPYKEKPSIPIPSISRGTTVFTNITLIRKESP